MTNKKRSVFVIPTCDIVSRSLWNNYVSFTTITTDARKLP